MLLSYYSFPCPTSIVENIETMSDHRIMFHYVMFVSRNDTDDTRSGTQSHLLSPLLSHLPPITSPVTSPVTSTSCLDELLCKLDIPDDVVEPTR